MKLTGSESQIDEQQIINSVVKQSEGGQLKFETLFARFHSYLLLRCTRQLGNPTDAEDVVQEVFFAAYRYLPSFQGRSSLKTWLTRIADNQCTAHFCKQSAIRQFSDETSNNDIAFECIEIMDTELTEQLFDDLSANARDILNLRYWGDLSTEEIANVLGIGRSAVKMRTLRAVKECRHLLQCH